MNTNTDTHERHRARWAAIGAAVAVSLGAGGIGIAKATSPDGAAAFVPITPCRLADTRPAPNNVGPKASPVGAGETHTFNGWASNGGTGDCDGAALPDGTTGLELNVTAVGPTENTNLRFWPDDEPMPLASNLNPSVGQPATPNSVSVTLSPTGRFNVFNFQGSVDVVIDVVGHYTDHDHDDRYYTKGQTNNRIQATIDAQPWSIGIAPSDLQPLAGTTSAALGHRANGGGDLAGMSFPDTGSASVWFGFQLPANYRAGTDIRVDMQWTATEDGFDPPTLPCDSRWTSIANVSRGGAPNIGRANPTWENPSTPTYSTQLTATQELWDNGIISETHMIFDGTDLQPGDMLTGYLFRANAHSLDTCTTQIMVTGLTAHAAD